MGLSVRWLSVRSVPSGGSCGLAAVVPDPRSDSWPLAHPRFPGVLIILPRPEGVLTQERACRAGGAISWG